MHQIPIGGEDLSRYVGAPQLKRSDGSEPFDTTSGGADVVEFPEVGEVVWCDGLGVTCRRWNWRQARRTQLSEGTTSALFILDALDPVTDKQLAAAADSLVGHLAGAGELTIARRTVGAD
jgi:DNA/RNA-binding domain of Phe-tRNA-synthetase-like protein